MNEKVLLQELQAVLVENANLKLALAMEKAKLVTSVMSESEDLESSEPPPTA